MRGTPAAVPYRWCSAPPCCVNRALRAGGVPHEPMVPEAGADAEGAARRSAMAAPPSLTTPSPGHITPSSTPNAFAPRILISIEAASRLVGRWLLCDRGLRGAVGARDVGIELRELYPPLAATAYLDCPEIAGSHQGVRLRAADREDLLDLLEGDEADPRRDRSGLKLEAWSFVHARDLLRADPCGVWALGLGERLPAVVPCLELSDVAQDRV